MIYSSEKKQTGRNNREAEKKAKNAALGNPAPGYAEEIRDHMKEELLLPAMKSIDPVSYLSKIFRESFRPSNEALKEYVLSGMEDTEKRKFFRKFSHISFERGLLSSAILNGKGQVMLIAAFRHSLGYQSPANAKEQRLFESSLSDTDARHIKILHNDWVNSACAIVSDAAKGASKALSAMKTAIEEGELQGRDGDGAFGSILPFLSVKRERGLIQSYRERIEELKRSHDGAPENATAAQGVKTQVHVLEDAISKVQGIINRKNQMKLRFLTVLEAAWSNLITFRYELDHHPVGIHQIFPGTSSEGAGEDGSGGDGGGVPQGEADKKGKVEEETS